MTYFKWAAAVIGAFVVGGTLGCEALDGRTSPDYEPPPIVQPSEASWQQSLEAKVEPPASVATAAQVPSSASMFTLDAHFDQGVLEGVNHDSPNNNQLQLSRVSTTEPYIWIANWTIGTVTKMDTRTGRQVAKYDSVLVRNWDGTQPKVRPPREDGSFNTGIPCGNSPSRTAVDGNGDAYVANRAFCWWPSVTKYAGSVGDCVDRNGNGVIDTSKDVNNNGIIDINDASEFKGQADECILWTRNYADQFDAGRSLAVDSSQNLWAGGYRTAKLYKLSGSTGAILQTLNPNAETGVNTTLYGIAIGPGGYIYTSNIDQGIYRKINPNAPAGRYVVGSLSGGSSYGIAVDRNGVAWLGYWGSGNSLIKADFNAKSVSAISLPSSVCSGYTRGIAVDGDGNIWAACWSTNRLLKFSSTGQFIGSWVVAPGPIGLGIDGDGNIWTVNQTSNSASRFNPTAGTVSSFPVSGEPYSYSDMTGFQQRNFTQRQGDWTAIHDGGLIGGRWGTVIWNTEPQGRTPPGTSITVKVRAADAVATLATLPWTSVSNGAPFSGVNGRYIEIEATLRILSGDVSPVLSDLQILPSNRPPVASCMPVTTCASPLTCTADASINAGCSDPDGDPLSLSQSPASPYAIGTRLVTLSVSDGQASAQCSANVTVNDCTPPTITCPADRTAECTGAGSALVDPGRAIGEDTCSGAQVDSPGPALYRLGTSTVTHTATDGAGLTASCQNHVTVVDTTPPAISCPADSLAECTSPSGAFVDPGQATATDVCTVATVTGPSAGTFPLGTTTLAYTATDGVGLTASCQKQVTVADTTPPAIVCPPDVTVECAGPAGTLVDPGHATASDVCSTPSVNDPGPSLFSVGSTPVAHTATDGVGLTASCQNTVTVVDTTPPVVVSPGAGEQWPPNHQYKRIDLLADCQVRIVDACSGSIEPSTAQVSIGCVSSDEPEDATGNGDGHTLNDIVIVDRTHVDLRVEREGTGDGRVYELHFTVQDGAGNVGEGLCRVGVPHDQSGRPAVDSGDVYTVCMP